MTGIWEIEPGIERAKIVRTRTGSKGSEVESSLDESRAAPVGGPDRGDGESISLA
jgi:hypothetical protein